MCSSEWPRTANAANHLHSSDSSGIVQRERSDALKRLRYVCTLRLNGASLGTQRPSIGRCTRFADNSSDQRAEQHGQMTGATLYREVAKTAQTGGERESKRERGRNRLIRPHHFEMCSSSALPDTGERPYWVASNGVEQLNRLRNAGSPLIGAAQAALIEQSDRALKRI